MTDLKPKLKKGIFAFAVAVYIAVLIYVVMLKNGGDSVRMIRLVPFDWLGNYLSGKRTLRTTLKNVLGNILLFVPLGVILPLLHDKITLKKCVAIGAALSLLAETAQYVFGMGISDIDDIITNTFGTFLGAGIYYGLFRRLKGSHTAIIIFLLVFGYLGFGAIWYYQPDLIFRRISYYGDSIAGVSMTSYDISATCYHINHGGLCITTNSVKINNPDYTGEVKEVCYFTNDTIFVIGEDGAYRAVTYADMKNRIDKAGKANVCIWFDPNETCKMILYMNDRTI